MISARTAIAALTAVIASTSAHAGITISNAASENMNCSGGTCVPTATKAVLNATDLENYLSQFGNVRVTTTGSGVEANNIEVRAAFSSPDSTSLTLEAHKAITVNAAVSVGSGTAELELQSDTLAASDTLSFGRKGHITFGSLSDIFGINGGIFTLVGSVQGLASAIAANPSGAFALAANYDAKKDGTYTSSPIATLFDGSFNGLGNSISNLSINDPTQNDNVGLFAETTGGSISNIRLVRENVQTSQGEIVGGLVGNAEGTIAHSLSTGTISGGNEASVGGLLGISSGMVTASGSTAAVSGGAFALTGGLIGSSLVGSSINGSWATGNVGKGSSVGGLVGYVSNVDIKNSWANGQVSAPQSQSAVGGLVGDMVGVALIERAHASGAVSCKGYCGGLLGLAQRGDGLVKISQSYATGTVTAFKSKGDHGQVAGGLVGYGLDSCQVANSYATGAASGRVAGGLVGENGYDDGEHSISNSYSAGTVAGTAYAGGAVGYDLQGSAIKHTFWDMTTSGITDPSQGAGNIANDPGIKGLSDKKLKSELPKGFDPKIWAEDPNINGGLPYLINNPPLQ